MDSPNTTEPDIKFTLFPCRHYKIPQCRNSLLSIDINMALKS